MLLYSNPNAIEDAELELSKIKERLKNNSISEMERITLEFDKVDLESFIQREYERITNLNTFS